MRAIISLISFVIVILVSITDNFSLAHFFDLPSLIIVLGTMLFLSIAKYKLEEIFKFTDDIVHSLISFALIGGGLGSIIGGIQIGTTLTDPNALGPAMSVNLLTMYCSLIISACLYAFKGHILILRSLAFLSLITPIIIFIISEREGLVSNHIIPFVIIFGTLISIGFTKFGSKIFFSFSNEVIASILNYLWLGCGLSAVVILVQTLSTMSDPDELQQALKINFIMIVSTLIVSGCLFYVKKRRIEISAGEIK